MPLPSLQDPRYAQIRNQLAWCAVGLVATAIGVTLLIIVSEQEKNEEIARNVEARERAAAEEKRAPEKEKGRQIEQWRTETDEAIQGRDWPRLEDLSKKILQAAPEDGDAWSKLGWAQGRKGEINNAMVAYTRAIALNFEPAFNLYQRACLYRQQGDYQAAVRDMKDAHERDPLSVVISNLYLIFRIQAGQAAEVRAEVSGFEKMDLEFFGSQYLLAAAALALKDGDVPNAVRLLTQFKALVPPDGFYELMQDPYFDAYRNESRLMPFFISS